MNHIIGVSFGVDTCISFNSTSRRSKWTSHRPLSFASWASQITRSRSRTRSWERLLSFGELGVSWVERARLGTRTRRGARSERNFERIARAIGQARLRNYLVLCLKLLLYWNHLRLLAFTFLSRDQVGILGFLFVVHDHSLNITEHILSLPKAPIFPLTFFNFRKS